MKRSMISSDEFKDCLHQSYIVGHEMMHFVEQLQNYIHFEVLESNWHDYSNLLDKGPSDLDELILLHDKYLINMQQKSLLISVQTDSESPAYSHILKILHSVNSYCSVEVVQNLNLANSAHFRSGPTFAGHRGTLRSAERTGNTDSIS